MATRFYGVLAFVLGCRIAAADDLPPELLLLSRIKAHVRRDFAAAQDYACVEMVHRYHKAKGAKAEMRPLDSIRLEVALIGQRELYSSPGGRSFHEGTPSAFTASGMMSNGDFALHFRTVFVNDLGTFTYRGPEELGGRAAVRYDFRVPTLVSGYTITIP